MWLSLAESAISEQSSGTALTTKEQVGEGIVKKREVKTTENELAVMKKYFREIRRRKECCRQKRV